MSHLQRKKKSYLLFFHKITQFMAVFYLSIALISILASLQTCTNKNKMNFIYPAEVDISSSRLLSKDSPYFSRALFDHDTSSPWISGDSLLNKYEYIRLNFHPYAEIVQLRIMNTYKQPGIAEKQKEDCIKFAEKKRKSYEFRRYKSIYGKDKTLEFPPECLALESLNSFSTIKKLEIRFTLLNGKNISSTRSIPADGANSPWINIYVNAKHNAQKITGLEIRFVDFYYGHKYNHLALGEVQLLGISSPENRREQLQNWYTRLHKTIVAKEFIYGKEFRLVDGSRYRFANDGTYEYITGINSSSMGSEKGYYSFDENGILLRFRRYEIDYDDTEPTINDLSQVKLSDEKTRYLNVSYLNPKQVLIQGNLGNLVN